MSYELIRNGRYIYLANRENIPKHNLKYIGLSLLKNEIYDIKNLLAMALLINDETFNLKQSSCRLIKGTSESMWLIMNRTKVSWDGKKHQLTYYIPKCALFELYETLCKFELRRKNYA